MRLIRQRALSLQRLLEGYVLPELREIHAEAKSLHDGRDLLPEINDAGGQIKEAANLLAHLVLEVEGRRQPA